MTVGYKDGFLLVWELGFRNVILEFNVVSILNMQKVSFVITNYLFSLALNYKKLLARQWIVELRSIY